MKLSQINAVAQEIVNATAPLVGGHTINMMDTTGLIVASSDPARVGAFHQGAAEALSRREIVRIYPADLPRYVGAKKGINIPIVKFGEAVGVVGILGDPDEVEAAANLLSVYVGLYLDYASDARQNALRRETRAALLRRLISGKGDGEELLQAGRELSLELRLPICVVAVRVAAENPLAQIKLLDSVEELLTARGLLNPAHDLCGVHNELLIVLKHIPAGFGIERYIQNVHDVVVQETGSRPVVAAGGNANDFAQLAQSFHEACALSKLRGEGGANMQRAEDRMLYMMCALKSGVAERFLAPLYEAFCDDLGEDAAWAFATIEAYCAAQFSINRAADLLHIHKNTLLYRVKKLLALIGAEDETSFTKQYYLKMLLLYHQSNH